MRHRGGPAKTFAPTIDPESSCPHRYTDDEGLLLEIDCTDCAGPHDLSNVRCIAGVTRVVSSGAMPESIVLRRFVHKRYRKGLLKLVERAARELAALNRALTTTDSLSDKECRTCAASRQQVIVSMKRKLLDDPRKYLGSGSEVLEELRRAHAKGACARESACVDSAFLASEVYGEGR